LESVTVTVTFQVPAAEGVHVRASALTDEQPDGKLLHVYCRPPEPGVAATVKDKLFPARIEFPGLTPTGPTVGNAKTVNRPEELTVKPFESVNVTPIVKVPWSEGMQVKEVELIDAHPVGSPDQIVESPPDPGVEATENTTVCPTSEDAGNPSGVPTVGSENVVKPRAALVA